MSGRAGTCPSCGAPLTFEVGSSHAAVCRFCKTLVARQGQGFALVGKVADLTPTGSRVALGAKGRYLGEAFTVAGRVQLSWTQGVWDEWYLSFPDERWGWLAEAQGRYYVTFPMTQADLPPAAELRPGFALELGARGRFVVTDIKDARFVSAAGELPAAVSLEGTSHSVDLEGTQGTFATLDYGDGDSDPDLFAGHQVTLDDLALHGGEAAVGSGPAPEGEALLCKNCGAPVTIRVPGQTVRLVCGSCNALLDASEGATRLVKVLKRHQEEPPIPLGTKGKLRGVDVLVVGWMQRGCTVSSVHYGWEELLLYEPKTTALSWLVLSTGHWSTARAIPAAEVQEHGNEAEYRDRRFRRYSSVIGKVERVLGEFPWQVTVGETAHLEDFVAPPQGLSSERNASELNWSHVEHLEPSEVASAFGIEGLASEPRLGVGAVQPWFFEAAMRPVGRAMAIGVVVACVLGLVLMLRGQDTVVRHTFMPEDLAAPEPPAEGEPPVLEGKVYSFLSEPIMLSGSRALEAHVSANLDNAWAWVEGAVIREETGDATLFGLEASYYHGYEDGESWSEGSLTASQVLASPPRGTYVVRADFQWDPRLTTAPAVSLELREGGASGQQFLAVLAVLLSPLLLLFHRRKFEQRRWEESNVEE
jgi:hypothetical protein